MPSLLSSCNLLTNSITSTSSSSTSAVILAIAAASVSPMIVVTRSALKCYTTYELDD